MAAILDTAYHTCTQARSRGYPGKSPLLHADPSLLFMEAALSVCVWVFANLE